jgi:hypothetical protein
VGISPPRVGCCGASELVGDAKKPAVLVFAATCGRPANDLLFTFKLVQPRYIRTGIGDDSLDTRNM